MKRIIALPLLLLMASLSLAAGGLVSGIQSNTSSVIVSVNANSTASGNSIILASSTYGGITVTLPAASSVLGQSVSISKVDTTTNTVTIKVNGSDVINGTGTLVLNAYTQTDSIIAAQSGLWIPMGQGLQITPGWTGPGGKGTTANTINTSSLPVCELFTTQVPVAIDSMTVHVSVIASGVDFGIYDTVGNRLGSTGATSPTLGRFNAPLTSVLNLPPGQYWQCISVGGTAFSIASLTYTTSVPPGQQTCAQAAGNYPLPATLPFPCTATNRLIDYGMWAHVVGGSL